MHMRSRRLALLVCAVGAASAASAEPLPGYRPGESFIFNFSVGAIQAGRARLAVGAPTTTPSGRRVAIHGDAESAAWLKLIARVHDVYRAQLDADGAPATRRVQIEEHGVRERTIDFVLDRRAAGTLLHLDIATPTQKRKEIHPLDGAPVDLVAALFFIRFRALAVGERFEFVFFDGPLFYRATARVLDRESVTWSGGPATAVRVDIDAVRIDWQFHTMGPVLERKHGTLLLSDDATHIPYRIEGDTDFGKCELELVAYQPGQPAVHGAVTPPPVAATPRAAGLSLRRAPPSPQ